MNCLDTVSRKISFVTVIFLESRRCKVSLHVIIKVISIYQSPIFKLELILMDNGLSGMVVNLLEKRVMLNGSSTNEHEPK